MTDEILPDIVFVSSPLDKGKLGHREKTCQLTELTQSRSKSDIKPICEN